MSSQLFDITFKILKLSLDSLVIGSIRGTSTQCQTQHGHYYLSDIHVMFVNLKIVSHNYIKEEI